MRDLQLGSNKVRVTRYLDRWEMPWKRIQVHFVRQKNMHDYTRGPRLLDL